MILQIAAGVFLGLGSLWVTIRFWSVVWRVVTALIICCFVIVLGVLAYEYIQSHLVLLEKAGGVLGALVAVTIFGLVLWDRTCENLSKWKNEDKSILSISMRISLWLINLSCVFFALGATFVLAFGVLSFLNHIFLSRLFSQPDFSMNECLKIISISLATIIICVIIRSKIFKQYDFKFLQPKKQ